MYLMSSTFIAWLLIFIAGISSCIGNLFLKYSSLNIPPPIARSSTFFDLLTNIYFITGLVFYGINVILFAKALEILPVSIAYPGLAGLGFLFLVIASYYIFDERLSYINLLGVLLIFLGLVLLSYGSK